MALHEKSDFSVQSLCLLCLCGCFFERFLNHRGTEDTEIAQRRSPIRTFRAKPSAIALPQKSGLTVGHSRYHLAVAGGYDVGAADFAEIAAHAPTRYREVVPTVSNSGF